MNSKKYYLTTVFLIIFFLASAFSVVEFQDPDPTLPTPTATAYPQDFLENSNITDSVVCGGIVLVLVIFGGSFYVLRQVNKKRNGKLLS